MKSRSLIAGTLAIVCASAVAGGGYTFAAQQKKSIDQRVAELESKVTTLELELKSVKAELARTPRLGMQTAK